MDGHYRGAVLFASGGPVSVTSAAVGGSGELRVALFWARPGGAASIGFHLLHPGGQHRSSADLRAANG